MDLTSGEIPYKPRLYGSEKQLPGIGKDSCSGDVFQHPFDFGGREISVHNKPCMLLYVVTKLLVFFYFLAHLRRPAALPYYRIVNRLARTLIPKNGGFALICNSYRGYIR